MPSYAGPPVASRPGEVASTLRLLAYLALTIALVILDHRGGWLSQVRAQANVVTQPLWWLAGLPGRLTTRVQDDAATRTGLIEENRRLRNEMLVANARLARLQTAAADNAQLRALLGVKTARGLDVQLAPILDIDLAPGRQRLVLDAGSRAGATVGQAVIDAGGLMGQIIETTPAHATVLLLTDPDHAVPVVVARNGVRLIVYGRGRSDLLELADVPLNSGVQVGDMLVTSGLGGRFPAGFPVGKVAALRPDDSHAFLVGDVTPAARLDRGRDVLLLKSAPPQPLPPADPSRFLPEAATPPQAAETQAPAAPTTQGPSPVGRGVGERGNEGGNGVGNPSVSAPATVSPQAPRPANAPTLTPTPLPRGEGLNGGAPATAEGVNRGARPSPRPTTQEPQR
ncbi:rod shape-determining protein MreC [Pseudoxanthomonas mexicana]|uniref:Cell shape-determining protein MreC n=1 Tax=Pseudoxanthomonas mexicana TaxID=128785 RepID=A0A7G9TFK4_PSEMX|nr:rod shape-determining protein MreC [Pseudoxanthomonas mexicana]MCP1585361.1 rod shape-determining protein MreC [Pseudoxanthomonas mexicana]QNN78879.1 rod shape-determining protein MreC [Pseudoxanthomonas mexicana]